MSPDTPSKSKICPTCGTRLSEDATRCLVCGTDLSGSEKQPSRSDKAIQGSRMPEITLNLPTAIGLLALFLTIGAVMVYFALRRSGQVVEPTPTATVTTTATMTLTPTPVTPTVTNTPAPTATPQSYSVKAGDTCSSIAYSFGISIQSIVLLNDLTAACDTLYEGQPLLIPQATPTPTEMPTATLSAAEATQIACGEIAYTVQDKDTLSSISLNYAVSINVLKEYNGMVNDTVQAGSTIKIPLCQRQATPGPSPTPTPPPPYAAPNLLLPADGAPFTLNDETITLQWAAVGTLRENESYVVTIVDVTQNQERKLVDYVTDTKYIVPTAFRPNDTTPHIIRWFVSTARQSGTDDTGETIWESAGAASAPRDFTWAGVAGVESTPTP